MKRFPILASAALALTCPIVLNAQQGMDVLTAEDVFDLEFVSDPQISPDGSQIVFVRQWSDPQTDRNFSNLWIMNRGGADLRPLTSGKQSDSWPRWSPDGNRLLYISDMTGSSQLHTRWMDTGATNRITNLVEEPRVPAWSPDGSRIVFSSFVPEAGMQLISMPEPPEGAEWAEPARVIHELVHRFDGAGDLEHGFTHLFVMPSEGGTPRQITSGNFHHGGYVGRSGRGRPVWSADGESVLIEANRHPDWELEDRNTEIYEVSPGR